MLQISVLKEMKNFITPVIVDRVDQLKFGTIDIETWSDPHSGQFIPYCAACYLDGKQFYAYAGDHYKVRKQRRLTVINDVIIVLLYRVWEHAKLHGQKHVVLYAHNLILKFSFI